jgi:hypothetical protein
MNEMIIVICAICGSDNISPGKHRNSFHCNECDYAREMWQVTFKTFEFPKIEEVDADQEILPTQD